MRLIKLTQVNRIWVKFINDQLFVCLLASHLYLQSTIYLKFINNQCLLSASVTLALIYKCSRPRRRRRAVAVRSVRIFAIRRDVSIFLSIPPVDYTGQINYRSHSTGSRPTNSLSRSRPTMTRPLIQRYAGHCAPCAPPKTRFAHRQRWIARFHQLYVKSTHSNIRLDRIVVYPQAWLSFDHAKNFVFDTWTGMLSVRRIGTRHQTCQTLSYYIVNHYLNE